MFVEIRYRYSNRAVAKGRQDSRRSQLIAFSEQAPEKLFGHARISMAYTSRTTGHDPADSRSRLAGRARRGGIQSVHIAPSRASRATVCGAGGLFQHPAKERECCLSVRPTQFEIHRGLPGA